MSDRRKKASVDRRSRSAQPRRIGIFGGSFDPIHAGHTRIATAARRQFRLDTIIFVPAWRSPLKPKGHAGHARHRIAMARLAVKGNRRWKVSSVEIDRKGTSYTRDTLRTFAGKQREALLYLIIGSDNLRSFGKWRSPGWISRNATLLVYRRPGFPVSRALMKRWNALPILGPPMVVSSSEIRKQVANGRLRRGSLLPSVARYAVSRGLYNARSAPQ